jgi:hypothetical protein
MPPHPNEVDTTKIEKVLEKHKEQCPYRKDKDTWFSAQMLKVAGVVIGMLSPLFVFIVVEVFTLKSDMALVKQKQETIIEIKEEIQEMRKDLVSIKIQLAAMNKGNP